MTTTDQDARALTYLARRLRDDTYGCGKWDENGTYAEVSKLVGQNLAVTIERVVAHACDPAAKTPGAIRRPFVPTHDHQTRPRDVAELHSRCQVCSNPEDVCRRLWADDHEFRRWEPKTVDIAPVVGELKDHAHPTVPRVAVTQPAEESA